MLRVKLDTSPLTNGHVGRGIGRYTRSLQAALISNGEVELITESTSAEKPDVVHYPFFDLFFSTLPIKKRAPTVVTIHDVIPLMFPEHYKAGVKGSARLLKQRLALRSVKSIVTDSEFSKQQIHSYLSIPLKSISVIHLAADESLRKSASTVVEEVRARLKLPSKYLLYVGDINYNKNIPQLIKLLKFIDDEIHLVCLGANFKPQPIPEWQWIETQMAMSDVENRVHFLSDIPVDDAQTLSAIYTGAEVYVQPSLAEGFGLPVLEAMQCHTPVVATNTSSLQEVGGEHALYTDPTAEALAEKVKEVVSWSAAKRQRWLAAGYAWTRNFTWAQVAERTVKIYTEVAHGT
jgi:glycosyltransferase involved in cell wall biosynthesis